MWVLVFLLSLANAAAPENCPHRYFSTGDKVFFERSIEVQGADAKSFVELHWPTSQGGCSALAYGKDKSRVYFEGKALEGASPQSFGIFGDRFAFSGNSIFFEGKLISGADHKSFLVGKNGMWATDKNHFYCGNHRLELSTLTVFDDVYVKDAKTVCRGAEPLPADSATFKVKDGKASDKNRSF